MLLGKTLSRKPIRIQGMTQKSFSPELVAPCGMNCGVCKAYLAYVHGVLRQRNKVTHCAGCCPRAKNCYIKRGCKTKKLTHGEIQSCSQCDVMPCEKLAHLDRRYRTRYGMSMVENLKTLKEKGMAEFLRLQAEKHTCPVCGDVVSVHDGKCYGCGYM
jgi:hypothetical protein